MDKRMTALLLVVYVFYGVITLGTLEFDDFVVWNQVVVPGIFLLESFGVPFIVLLGVVWIVLAVSGSLSRPKTVDGRCFTRCLFYRIASGAFALLFSVFQLAYAMDFPLIARDPDQMCSVANVKMRIFSFPAGFFLLLILNAMVTTYVILGITSAREKKIVSPSGTVVHIILQFIMGLDFISALYLMIKESKSARTRELTAQNM